jgi:hypothetical protein
MSSTDFVDSRQRPALNAARLQREYGNDTEVVAVVTAPSQGHRVLRVVAWTFLVLVVLALFAIVFLPVPKKHPAQSKKMTDDVEADEDEDDSESVDEQTADNVDEAVQPEFQFYYDFQNCLPCRRFKPHLVQYLKEDAPEDFLLDMIDCGASENAERCRGKAYPSLVYKSGPQARGIVYRGPANHKDIRAWVDQMRNSNH